MNEVNINLYKNIYKNIQLPNLCVIYITPHTVIEILDMISLKAIKRKNIH